MYLIRKKFNSVLWRTPSNNESLKKRKISGRSSFIPLVMMLVVRLWEGRRKVGWVGKTTCQHTSSTICEKEKRHRQITGKKLFFFFKLLFASQRPRRVVVRRDCVDKRNNSFSCLVGGVLAGPADFPRMLCVCVTVLLLPTPGGWQRLRADNLKRLNVRFSRCRVAGQLLNGV